MLYEKFNQSNLVLDDLPVVERGRDIFILHYKVDFLLDIIHIGILEDPACAGVDSEFTSKPESESFVMLCCLCCLYSTLLCAQIPGIIFQTFPVSIVK